MDFHSPKTGASKPLALKAVNWSQQLPKFTLPTWGTIRGTKIHHAEIAPCSCHLALSLSRKNITSFRTNMNTNSLIWDFLVLMVHLGAPESSEVQWIFTLALIEVTHLVPLCNYKMQDSSEFSTWKCFWKTFWVRKIWEFSVWSAVFVSGFREGSFSQSPVNSGEKQRWKRNVLIEGFIPAASCLHFGMLTFPWSFPYHMSHTSFSGHWGTQAAASNSACMDYF